ncbi:MAG: hypothetical protein GOMPHAMPRED_005010 [Gomphillus americanus]|uniref:Zn(2)-C6 fungal-type domain-containing protein n=1 Tax=Gomphillus americanus TaxID=1940652 RepID=A0A8H3EI86_9LECA|nr:MAG: hypothetical protein GOMPHAMPRED_005010 [Gomphillus americanus]
MATLPPPSHLQQQDPYGNYAVYPPHAHAQITYLQNSAQPQSFPTQPAPRQRTAIACRYCRRRKIRCHGFDSSPDGRCTNCLRFNQECIFTPVSSQAHAFVPAHTAYPFLRNNRQAGPDGRPLSYPVPGQPGPPLYGPHGQPLGPVGQPPEQGYSASPPQTAFNPAQYTPPPPTAMQFEEGNKNTRTLPIRRGSSSYEYPDPRQMAPPSPASSAISYQNIAYSPSGAQPYYTSTTPSERRTSPTTSYFGPRPTESPHGNHTHPVLPPPSGLHPPQVLPASFENGRNTSPSTSVPRTEVLPSANPTRSSTDNDMLNALTRHRR